MLLTIGIVFVLLQIRKGTCAHIQEPFQTGGTCDDYLNGVKCIRKVLATTGGDGDGRNIILCSGGTDETAQERALAVIQNCSDTALDSFNSAAVNSIKYADAVCYTEQTPAGDVYMCYDRPPPIEYNPDMNTYNEQDPQFDPVPDLNGPTIKDTCNTYQAVTNMLFRTFSTTTVNKTKVNSGIASLVNARQQISTLYTNFCGGIVPAGTKQQKCAAIQEFLTNTANSSNLATLQDMNSRLGSALSNLQSYYTNEIQSGYTGIGCPIPGVSKPAGLV